MVVVRGGIRVKDHVQKCADEVVAEFGSGLTPGTYNGHSPPEGPTQALDLFTRADLIGWGLQSQIADWLIKNQRRFGIRYVIRYNPTDQDWIWNIERASEGWRAMATRDHRDHVHVTFYASVIDEPELELGGTMLSGRYTFDGLDWVFDGPSHIHAPVGTMGILKICDKAGVAEWGAMKETDHNWFRDVASQWT